MGETRRPWRTVVIALAIALSLPAAAADPTLAEADDLFRRAQWREAAAAYGRALELTDNAAERRFLERRLRELPN